MIPKIIHQTWGNKEMPIRFNESIESWKKYHTDYEYKFWSDNDIKILINENFSKEVISVFNSLPDIISKVDMGRLCILYIYGGIYSDLDKVCIINYDELLENDALYLTKTEGGYSNDLMISQKMNEDILLMITNIYNYWYIPIHYLRIMITAGPLFLSKIVKKHNLNIIVLSNEYRGKDIEGNTWHYTYETFLVKIYYYIKDMFIN